MTGTILRSMIALNPGSCSPLERDERRETSVFHDGGRAVAEWYGMVGCDEGCSIGIFGETLMSTLTTFLRSSCLTCSSPHVDPVATSKGYAKRLEGGRTPCLSLSGPQKTTSTSSTTFQRVCVLPFFCIESTPSFGVLFTHCTPNPHKRPKRKTGLPSFSTVECGSFFTLCRTDSSCRY